MIIFFSVFAHFLLSGFRSSDLELSKSLVSFSTGRPHYKSSPDSLQVLLRILAESIYTSPQMQRPINVSNALRYNFYTYSLLHGTNIATIYYFPNKISKKYRI